nr:glycosyltransferase family 1 protein [Bdellovibrio sp. HM001]
MSKKVYLDCTFTYQSGLNTGIQRVVRNLIARAALAKEEYGYEFCPVVCILNRYYKVDVEDVLKVRPTIAQVGSKGKEILAKWKSIGPSWVKPMWDWVEFALRRGFALVKYLRLLLVSWRNRKERVVFESGSVFVLLDVFWTYDVTKAIKNSDHGLRKVVAVIYDLIPITHSQFVEEVNCRNFSRALPRLFTVVDQFICISRSVAQDLSQYAVSNGLSGPRIDSFRLGSDFVPKIGVVGGELVKSIFSAQKPWLVVGTIEPRKNHGFILDAFELLWASGYKESLVVVGRVGWMCEDIMSRINSHPELGKKMFLLQSVSDPDLQYCYAHAKGLIFASHAEGFGLPLVEAMAMKIPVICSDIPVFREIGSDYPSYFSLRDPQGLARAIVENKGVGSGSFEWPNWDGSLREFVRHI